jgi:SAM-dependent methyltransferase
MASGGVRGRTAGVHRLAGRLAVVVLTAGSAAAETGLDEQPYVPYVATPEAVVEEMLEIAQVGPADVVYDLGSGDGRIVIAAARQFGARGVGIEIDPARVRESVENAAQAAVGHLVRFLQADFFAADLREATVVTLYLLPEVNRQLLPKLLTELRPGSRIVSYNYGLGDWAPAKTSGGSRGTIYYWMVPARLDGKEEGG